jgi:chromosome transmission fidelity protein 4
VRTNDFGGSWTPAFSSREAKKRADERHWIVSVAARDADGAAAGVYCVVCRADAPGPNVHPRPVLTPLPLSFPVALPEASSGELEENAAKARLAATLVEAAARNAETTLGADEDGWAAARAGADAAADKAALRLFHAACKGERPARAADIAASLRLSNSLDGALRLANALHQPALARRVTDLIEASMAAQAARERHEHYAYAHPELSQLATPGQAGPYPSQEPSSRAAPAEEANPFARRAANASKENERQKPEEENADDRSAAVKTKAGFEANATTPAKKSRAANPFARK